MSLGTRITKVLTTASPIGVSFKRYGKDNDGGYVMVDDLTANDFLISMGIANDVSFEQDLSKVIKGSHMYDFSISSLPNRVVNGLFFREKIGGDSQHVFSKVSPGTDILLKVDIEGSEWSMFEKIPSSTLLRCRQIVMEIHWSIINDYINVPTMPVDVLEKIAETHQLVVVHPNNYGSTVSVGGVTVPQVLELTWLRKDSYAFSIDATDMSHLLMPNNPLAKEITGIFNDS